MQCPDETLLIKQLSATPTIEAQNGSTSTTDTPDAQVALQANRATFFFRLERELEKVNAFTCRRRLRYVSLLGSDLVGANGQKLKLRLKSLLDKKKSVQARSSTASKLSASFITLEEGFQQFCNDLNKLQQFIDINNTGFSKILKKWDKTSKSRTKELYLSRAVEVQPCFNRDVISDLSDQATTSLQELGAWADGESTRYESSKLQENTTANPSLLIETNDTEAQISQIVRTGNADVLKEWLGRMKHSTEMREKVTRAFLAAVGDAPDQSLSVFIESGVVDIQAEDEINERNCLHEAAISGREVALQMGVSNNIDVSRTDIYGRTPLHYACMYGHVEMVRTLLPICPQVIDMLDHDNFTPLIHAIVHAQFDCAEQLLDHGARIDPERDSDHVPLDLACQYGATAIAELLLERNAKLLPDAEGLYPQHLVARSGIAPQTLLLLEKYGADLDQPDKLYQWSPLLHAASEGHVECLRTLLQRGVDISMLDEKGYSAMYYATWEGHLECMELLRGFGPTLTDEPKSRLTQASYAPSMQTVTVAAKDSGGIPDLSLPPPIIPLRRYGHNFLDHKTYIQITFQSMESAPLLFYHDSKYPAARLTISSKSSDVIPRNIMLPLQEESRIVSFQIDNLTSFAIDFDIYPTFGSKIIARSVALPSLFIAITHSSGRCCLPLFDPRLRAIGQISFDFQVIKPFAGISLDITHFATYWRATSQLDVHPTGFITGSSLSGDYVQLFVQLTKDGVPVLYPRWSIDYHGLDQHISRLTHEQCQALGNQCGTSDQLLHELAHQTVANASEIHQALASSLLALEDVLRHLPMSVHANIQVLFPTPAQEQELGLGPSPNINDFADGILKDVFEHARSMKERDSTLMRSIVFSSYNVDICTALNWKQPNYPVLLCNDLGRESDGKPSQNMAMSSEASVHSDGRNSMSIKEAVRVAQSNNFMGLVCSSPILKMVPSLIESIKVAGLVLVMDTTGDEGWGSQQVGATACRMGLMVY